MKNLYLIGGTMGVGKTTVCQYLKKSLPNAVFLDGDWCWDADPFQVTAETKQMVLENICYLLNAFIRCAAYENILFCWVMHEQSIIDAILQKVDTSACTVKVISLMANRESLHQRIMGDVAKGVRSADVFERSLNRMPFYASLDTTKIQTDEKTIAQIAAEIMAT